MLNEWKKFRVLLSRIDTAAAPDIEWPEYPTGSQSGS
ncbi:tail fiber assembly protein [Enterobacteriaceae bacterium YMB-R22]|uniref:Tail fiber assembly protein n=2 Tax=Tenebrionibacter/Tenebrionicola group TaxID=2969848 RepID=A0A8K0V7T3_9ENTR|nr:tail fiber assembly protein [Tenebrionibacter intestinalis]MBV4413673.1 tail fiber assembly protein [Tenebrionicola larvae]MBV5097201.1 tail fiber assembly protein [Tenebrionicola larvae]